MSLLSIIFDAVPIKHKALWIPQVMNSEIRYCIHQIAFIDLWPCVSCF